MTAPTKLLFLPGAFGNVDFWRPVSERLTHPAARSFLAYPGFGGVPTDHGVNGFDDLVARVIAAIDQPVALLAQSMGGAIALHAALTQRRAAGGSITHLILTVTSGGLDVAAQGGADWRSAWQRDHPTLPRWFSQERRDLSARLPELRIPSLLLWGDADPISPVAVGQRLASLLPVSELHVLQGGDHDLVSTRAAEVAPLIDAHLHTQP
jgi:pimeloyl-ACP methyl ester carboxylesterase